MQTQNSEVKTDVNVEFTPLQYALAYARKGWPVLPLHSVSAHGDCTCGKSKCGKHAGKHPRIKDWLTQATTEEKQIKKWWRKWSDANIGILTGKASGILAVDIDPRNGGAVELQKLKDDYGDMPHTPTVSTGGDGLHYYLKMPDFEVITMCGDHALRDGVEIRSDGGMVVAPPGLHPSGGCYNWLVTPADADLAEVPLWLVELLRETMQSRQIASKKGRPIANDPIPDGMRNATLTRIAGERRRKGKPESQIFNLLLEVNRDRCVPPLPDEEVRQIAHSVGKYAPKSKVGKPSLVSNVTTPIYRLTDLGNAERLVERHGQDIRYCVAWRQWLVWDEKRWVKDTKKEISRRAFETVRSIYDEAAKCADDAQRQALAKHAVASESEKRIKAMISLAQAQPGVAITPEEMDTDHWVLNVENGTLDMRTRVLSQHNHGDHLTKITHIAHDPEVGCPTWQKFLHRIMDGNTGLIYFLQKAVGYALTGDVSEQVIFFLYGSTGKNGKSTFLNTIKDLLGDYARNMQPDTLMVKQTNRINNDVARLHGARFVAAVEGDEGQRLSEALVKQMTGGDTMDTWNGLETVNDYPNVIQPFKGTA